ncbi:MAG: hypothetical protein KGJ37_03140 [Verrucomicrobiota bacterium]|nr:hypothetical protein [Verrucomicrobiota bacterium]
MNAAQEINRLHDEASRLAAESKYSLHQALTAAWRAGQLLLAEKKRVRHTMGPGAWLHWLEQNFHGARRTAQKYMQLAQSVNEASLLQGMSLRQVYLRLGIATEPKSRANSPRVESLPSHVRLANQLLAVLKPSLPLEQSAAYRRDLRALYERLRVYFETEVTTRTSPLLCFPSDATYDRYGIALPPTDRG